MPAKQRIEIEEEKVGAGFRDRDQFCIQIGLQRPQRLRMQNVGKTEPAVRAQGQQIGDDDLVGMAGAEVIERPQ